MDVYLDETPCPTDPTTIAPGPDRYAPRPSYSPHEPPDRAQAGGFVAGLVVGVAVTVAVLLVYVAARWAFGKFRPADGAGEQTPTSGQVAVDLGEPSSENLWLWAKPLDRKQGSSTGTVYYRKTVGLDPEAGEDADYEPLSPLSGEEGQEVTMFRRDDGLYLYLKVKFGIDPLSGEAQGDLVTLKFKPGEKAVGEVKVKRGAGVPKRDPCTSEITVRSDTGGEVTLVPKDEKQGLIAGGSATVTLAPSDDSTFPYIAVFRNVPWGRYYVGDYMSVVSEANPQDTVTLNSAAGAAP